MSIEELKALQDKRAEIANELRSHADRQAEWNAEDEAKWDTLNASYDDVKAKIDEHNAAQERAAKVQNRLADITNAENDRTRRIGRDGASLAMTPPRHGDVFGQPVENQALALQGWLRNSHDPHDVGEVTDAHRRAAAACGVNLSGKTFRIGLSHDFQSIRNDLAKGTPQKGGYTFGETFITNLELAMLAFGGMFQTSEVIRTSTGEPMRWPTANDTANTGVQLGENTSIGSSVDPTFAQVIWNAYKFSSQAILVPFELLRDNAVNLAAVIPQMLGERLGRIQNTKYTTGSGASTAKGIVTCAAAGVTAASQTAIAFDEIIDLEHSLDPSRRNMPGVGYMFHDNVLKALRKLKDGMGQYLWQSGANSGAPDTLNRYPYQINQDMASSIATTATTMLFGQLSAYKIRQVASIRLYRLEERYRDTDQDGFIAFIEGDGNLLDAGDNPVKKLVQA